jgi:hypothetical protein
MKASFTTAIRTGRAFFETGLMKSSLAVMAANDRIGMRDSTGVHDSVVLCPGWY